MTKKDRISAPERREQILQAATLVFGEVGYAAATTDRVAQAAGISQPYVVRMFGSKENLIVEVLERTCDRILETFRSAIADTADPRTPAARIGAAYVDLVETDRGVLLSLMQGFIMGGDPRVGPVARAGIMRIYALLREQGGFTPEAARDFFASGMLINTLVASGLVNALGSDPAVAELFECTFRDKLPMVVERLGTATARPAEALVP
ncbi:TetR/AcrR family transcriptional regulator [Rathayibacter sp. YIM 133350]|uniref:TetR/AcrR family transcriptional regulator n=1 Tax=Rathayibacter sp. YIM 133350 TaxID=3131992 RepID=UPI00307D19FC